MKFAGCGQQSPPGAWFCAGCGARLVPACSACGAELPVDARFCPRCGQPSLTGAPADFASPATYTPKHLADRILTSRAALEGERKQGTVLFVDDVSGFTALSARLDPEDVLMKHEFEIMLAEVHRYEGTVNQFLGDGIMALFGAPVAHEDHAQRAVRAALGIQRVLEDYRRGLEREIAVAERIGDCGFMPRMMNTLGWLHIECDDVERGIDVTARAAAFARDIRHAYGVEM